MLDEITLEKRLTVLEQTVSDLQQKVQHQSPENWLTRLSGSISDEAAFLEALEYGRAFRQADQTMDKADE